MAASDKEAIIERDFQAHRDLIVDNANKYYIDRLRRDVALGLTEQMNCYFRPQWVPEVKIIDTSDGRDVAWAQQIDKGKDQSKQHMWFVNRIEVDPGELLARAKKDVLAGEDNLLVGEIVDWEIVTRRTAYNKLVYAMLGFLDKKDFDKCVDSAIIKTRG